MYYPFFRGKQYELVTVREMAPVLKAADFCPVIEPVRETLGGLHKALKAIESEDGRAIVVVNPHHGDLSGAGTTLTQLLQDEFLDIHGISAGILLKSETSLQEALECYAAHSDHGPAFVHSGFADAKALADSLGVQTKDQCHIFLDRFCGKLYQKHFKEHTVSFSRMDSSVNVIATTISSSHSRTSMRRLPKREWTGSAIF